MGGDAAAVVEAADAVDDRFVAMQALPAVGYSANFRGPFAEAEAAQQRAAAIARQDEKAYRLTVVLGGLALGLALQGRVAETEGLFAEAKAANPAYRESILVELQTLVRWIAGDFTAAVALAREGVAWQPGATARRRAIGMVFGALAAIESEEVVEAEGLLARAQAGVRRAGQVFLPPGDALGRGGARMARGSHGRVRGGAAARNVAGAGHGGPGCGRLCPV
jgi:hypothetical protein